MQRVLRPPVFTKKVIDSETISAGGNFVSEAIKLNEVVYQGYFSLQVEVSGDGTCKFEAEESVNGVDFLVPSEATDIASGVTKTSGPGSDGKDIYSFYPLVAGHLKIKVTETGGVNSVTVSAWVAIQ